MAVRWHTINLETQTWDVAPGLYAILVGSSSQNIELRRPLVNLFASSLSVLESSPVPEAKKASGLLIERRKRSDSNKRCGGSNSDGQQWQRGGQHVAGALVTVRADPPPPGKEFAGWSGDTQILANPSEETTTATIPRLT